MEYCHEGTLWTIAQQGLPEDMIRRYTRDLLRAVDMLHDKGIIHRDIKGMTHSMCTVRHSHCKTTGNRQLHVHVHVVLYTAYYTCHKISL